MTQFDDERPLSEAPRDIPAEQAALGAMLYGAGWIGEVADVVKAEDFYEPRHETLFQVIQRMYVASRAVDAVTLAAELSRRGILAKVGGAPYLHTLMNAVPVPSNGSWYAQRVAEIATRRRMIFAGTRIKQMGIETGEEDLDAALSRAQSELDAVMPKRKAQDVGVAEAVEQVLEEIEHPGTTVAYSAGLKALQEVYRGAGPGRLDVIAARPGVGKSVLSNCFIRENCIKKEIPMVLFSLEMSTMEIMQRLIAAEARVNLSKVVDAARFPPDSNDWARLAAATPRVSNAPLTIIDRPVGLAQVQKETRMAAKRGAKIAIVDYLQLMLAPYKAESRQVAVSANIDGLKMLGRELDVAVIALSQLNRNPAARGDGVPRLSDLRESGSIEQSADCVILIHRPDMEEPESPRAGEADLIVAKQRNGRTGIATVVFRGHYAQFNDFAPDRD